jgi:Uma2 family endonuclease
VEVVSPGNSAEELMMKKALYFEKGAREFWICGEDGRMNFFSLAGEIEASALCPGFPPNIRTGQVGA